MPDLSLLDWIFVTHSERLINSEVLPDCFSDHSASVSGRLNPSVFLRNAVELDNARMLILIISYMI